MRLFSRMMNRYDNIDDYKLPDDYALMYRTLLGDDQYTYTRESYTIESPVRHSRHRISSRYKFTPWSNDQVRSLLK